MAEVTPEIRAKARESIELSIHDTDDGSLGEKGRCWGKEFCPHPGSPCIDGCAYCGRPIGRWDGNHNHTELSKGQYSCVCDYC